MNNVLVFYLAKLMTFYLYLKALMQAIEHELEVTVRVHEVRSAHERQMEEYVLLLSFDFSSETFRLSRLLY